MSQSINSNSFKLFAKSPRPSSSRSLLAPKITDSDFFKFKKSNSLIFGDNVETECLIERVSNMFFETHFACSPKCLLKNPWNSEFRNQYLKSNNPFLKPLAYHFVRCFIKIPSRSTSGIVYIAPCGVVLNSYALISRYLFVTCCEILDIDNFTFSRNLHIARRVCPAKNLINPDISNGLEKNPVPLISNVPEEANLDRQYIKDSIYDKQVLKENKSILSKLGQCHEICSPFCFKNCKCTGIQDLPYLFKRLFDHKKIIYECTSKCDCSIHCYQKVVSRGLNTELQVYRIPKKGWAVRATHFITKGMFVCAYVGDIITSEAKNQDGSSDEYAATVGKITTNNNGTFTVDRDNFSDPKSIIIDGLNKSNLACYINHSCNPNLFVNTVVIENDLNLMTVTFALFAIRYSSV
ncbi:hypothetical protein SSS_02642 [Sarcoptes scabiei]|nr:hypothetical protein SSS_02642 [Sarcoptes scabiei]